MMLNFYSTKGFQCTLHPPSHPINWPVQSTAPKKQDLNLIFKDILTKFTVDQFNRHDAAIAIEEAISLSKNYLLFTDSDGADAFRNYSRIFTITDNQRVGRQYALREKVNEGADEKQLELVLLDKFSTIEKGPAIDFFPGINLDDLRQRLTGI